MEHQRPTELSDLPNEMLEEIFNFLEDPNDFLSVVGTCHRWNDLMSYRKTERLFGNAMKIYSLIKYILTKISKSFDHVQMPIFIAQVLPILLKSSRVPLRTMLTLRQISKKWKQEADLQLEEDPSRLWWNYDLIELEKVNRLRTHASNLPPGGNPFIGKHLSITMIYRDAFDSIHQLIQQHGAMLRSIRINFFFPIQFAPILGGVPNLETLSIFGSIRRWDIEDEPDAPLLPPLLRLNNLCIGIFGAGPGDQAEPEDNRYLRLFASLLTSYGKQLATLRCSKQLLRIGMISDLLANLKRLELYRAHLLTDTYTLPDLQVLSQVEWRLHTLSISNCNIPFTAELMAALNNFSATLEDLKISIELEESFDADSLVCFPLLKKLELGITSELRNIPLGMKDRLIKVAGVAPNLEELDIDLQNGAMCDVVWSMESMTNVVSAFQKLDVFSVQPSLRNV